MSICYLFSHGVPPELNELATTAPAGTLIVTGSGFVLPAPLFHPQLSARNHAKDGFQPKPEI